MFALSDILSFEGEKIKILKPVWEVIAEYLVKSLVLLSLLFAGMQFISGRFECVPAVECPAISRRNTNWSSLISQIKYRNVCKPFYSSQKTRNTETTYVITDIKTIIQYAGFVNSECSKCAIPKFLAYFWIVLFAESFALLVIGHLWLKIPAIASFIERFSTLVMECYDSPSSNLEGAQRLEWSITPHNVSKISYAYDKMITGRESFKFNFTDDAETVNKVKTLHKKVNQFKMSITSCPKWKICLVPAFAGGLIFYLIVLVITFVLFIFMIGWTLMKKCKFNAPSICVEEDGDLGFLLHLLHNSNKIHVVHFATYLTKIEAYLLANEFPVSKLREISNKAKIYVILPLHDLPGIPLTIFYDCNDIQDLRLKNCGPLVNDDFKYFTKLTSLLRLVITGCGLKCIPRNILELQELISLSIKEDSIESISFAASSGMLKNLDSLQLLNTGLKFIEGLEHLDNLTTVMLDFNPKLELSALQAVLKCKKLKKLEIPEHLKEMADQLKASERDKYDRVIQPDNDGYSY
ncbi:Hypothetical predicted protein, partial [Paramuricea clavata]